ncbi:hypothetical protein ACH5RR_020320 [Cinchona calisaya]|uniref:Uncharacterized protein n=1 Tax=Cinchona calisaya TaxID=153742 RepID=A0ABD2ZE32_9GENT
MGGWSYPDISLEDLMRVIKGFVDMLVLSSGYQSSGRLAHWDSHNIKKVFQWAIFLENVLKCLRSSDDYQDSLAELDAALSKLTSNTFFPQGLRHISATTLSNARDLTLKHLVHTLSLRDTHLRASVAALIEMDIDELRRISSDGLRLYLERLMNDASKDFVLTRNRTVNFSDAESSKSSMSSLDGSSTMCAVQELGRRQMEVSCISAVETGLDVLSKMIGKSSMDDHQTTLCGQQQLLTTFMTTEERPVEPMIWSHWKSRSLSYLLGKRTIRLVSGANLLFSAPKHQWVQVIKRMDVPADTDEFYEKIELLLLGSIAHKWSSLIEKVMSSSYECLTISKLYQEVQNTLSGRLQNLCSEENMFPEEKSALEYLEGFLSKQFHKVWKLFPVLPAMAIPSRSMLFRSYLIELESQMRGDSSAIRLGSAGPIGSKHGMADLGRRIAGSGSAATLGSVLRKVVVKDLMLLQRCLLVLEVKVTMEACSEPEVAEKQFKVNSIMEKLHFKFIGHPVLRCGTGV